MKINLLLIATNNYLQFLEKAVESANRYFCTDHEVNFCVFTDKIPAARAIFRRKPYKERIHYFEVEHTPFPGPTLYRFEYFARHKAELPEATYFFYVDVDAEWKDKVRGSDVLSERTAVQHCGYVGERGTYEENIASTAYVAPGEGIMYFGGGFWGFVEKEFWRMVETLRAAIQSDEKRGVLAIWHDESHLNRYLIDNPPTKILTPSYHFPQNHHHIWGKWAARGLSFDCVLLLLQKDHKKLRT